MLPQAANSGPSLAPLKAVAIFPLTSAREELCSLFMPVCGRSHPTEGYTFLVYAFGTLSLLQQEQAEAGDWTDVAPVKLWLNIPSAMCRKGKVDSGFLPHHHVGSNVLQGQGCRPVPLHCSLGPSPLLAQVSTANTPDPSIPEAGNTAATISMNFHSNFQWSSALSSKPFPLHLQLSKCMMFPWGKQRITPVYNAFSPLTSQIWAVFVGYIYPVLHSGVGAITVVVGIMQPWTLYFHWPRTSGQTQSLLQKWPWSFSPMPKEGREGLFLGFGHTQKLHGTQMAKFCVYLH